MICSHPSTVPGSHGYMHTWQWHTFGVRGVSGVGRQGSSSVKSPSGGSTVSVRVRSFFFFNALLKTLVASALVTALPLTATTWSPKRASSPQRNPAVLLLCRVYRRNTNLVAGDPVKWHQSEIDGACAVTKVQEGCAVCAVVVVACVLCACSHVCAKERCPRYQHTSTSTTSGKG